MEADIRKEASKHAKEVTKKKKKKNTSFLIRSLFFGTIFMLYNSKAHILAHIITIFKDS